MKKILLIFCLLTIISSQSNANSASPNQIFKAVQNGEVKSVQQLIKNGADVNIKDKDGKTPLHYAAYNENFKIVKLLVKNGANVNAEYYGATPLYFATLKNNAKIMKYLIKKGADVNTKLDNLSALLSSSMNCYKEAIEVLMKNKAEMLAENVGLTPIEAVALSYSSNCSLNKKEEILKIMIKYGADINMTNPYITSKYTALDAAVSNGYSDVENLLIKLGAKSGKELN